MIAVWKCVWRGKDTCCFEDEHRAIASLMQESNVAVVVFHAHGRHSQRGSKQGLFANSYKHEQSVPQSAFGVAV